ncbi:hypothetical protein HJC23_003421 [Cyclotella cryptica]|uniref:Uncharacterized protein n=1 Tax=Cyclotella cryptica TaxID=29204 RepID=A0ABD3QT70_9STRA
MSDRLFEGIGAPVRIAQNDADEIADPPDPTLDSCCQREIESNRKRNALVATLRAHDRVAQAENLRRQQLSLQSGYTYKTFNLINGLSFGSGCRCCYEPNGDGGEYELLAAARKEREIDGKQLTDDSQHVGDHEVHEQENAKSASKNESDNSDSDDEFDYLLDEEIETTSHEHDLQATRRAELENIARHYEVLRYHGFGVHRQMHPQRVFSYVGYCNTDKDRYVPAGAVLHLYDAFSPRSVSLDLCLEDMARRYPGTKFVRALGITSILFAEDCDDSHKWKNGDLPMLLALKGGKVVAFSSGLCDFSYSGQEEQVEPRVVEQWLDYAGVLIDNPPPMEAVCRIRPEEEMLLENMRQLQGLDHIHDEAEHQTRYDCGVDGCNKTFYHEHIGVKNDAQDGILVSESQVVSSVDPS